MKWEGTVNIHDRPEKNIPMDLHMEHIDKECKQAMRSLGSNIGDTGVKWIGKSIWELMKEVSQKP